MRSNLRVNIKSKTVLFRLLWKCSISLFRQEVVVLFCFFFWFCIVWWRLRLKCRAAQKRREWKARRIQYAMPCTHTALHLRAENGNNLFYCCCSAADATVMGWCIFFRNQFNYYYTKIRRRQRDANMLLYVDVESWDWIWKMGKCTVLYCGLDAHHYNIFRSIQIKRVFEWSYQLLCKTALSWCLNVIEKICYCCCLRSRMMVVILSLCCHFNVINFVYQSKLRQFWLTYNI